MQVASTLRIKLFEFSIKHLHLLVFENFFTNGNFYLERLFMCVAIKINQ